MTRKIRHEISFPESWKENLSKMYSIIFKTLLKAHG
jgi:hypothetical protein